MWGDVLSKKWTFCTFLSVGKGGGGAGACSRDFVLNPCADKSEYIRFKQISD